jgi:hypothetical protein
MWVWVGPKWMRPGSRFNRAMWLLSLPVAGFLTWFAWAKVGTGPGGTGVAFLVVWTLGVVAIEAWNFRTMYLGRGRRAEAVQRAIDEQDAR